MKYFLDTEFIEGKQDKTFLGFKYGETKPTIDLISIGIVSEDLNEPANNGGILRERYYYAISKDFNLKEAWNREWVRENILKPIYKELKYKNDGNINSSIKVNSRDYSEQTFTYSNLKKLVSKYGKTNKQIAEEIKEFVYNPTSVKPLGTEESIEFYGWYSATDWVLFYSLYGSLMNRPKFFPMRCNDLKQLADEVQGRRFGWKEFNELPLYPKKSNEHNALFDAKWNKKLYEFLTNIQ